MLFSTKTKKLSGLSAHHSLDLPLFVFLIGTKDNEAMVDYLDIYWGKREWFGNKLFKQNCFFKFRNLLSKSQWKKRFLLVCCKLRNFRRYNQVCVYICMNLSCLSIINSSLEQKLLASCRSSRIIANTSQFRNNVRSVCCGMCQCLCFNVCCFVRERTALLVSASLNHQAKK